MEEYVSITGRTRKRQTRAQERKRILYVVTVEDLEARYDERQSEGAFWRLAPERRRELAERALDTFRDVDWDEFAQVIDGMLDLQGVKDLRDA